jgi:hypothetical protein
MKAVCKIRRLKRGRLSGLVEMRCSRYSMQFREAVKPQYDAKPNKQAYRDINTTVCFTPLFVDMPARNAAQSGSTGVS